MVTAAREGVLRVRVRVPSKINLFLGVRDRRDDGFHDVVTVLQTISIHDLVLAEIDRSPTTAHPAARRFMELSFTQCADGDVPSDGHNLAVRAARALMESMGIGAESGDGTQHPPVTRLHLDKHIPVAAGMAGGSADAAAALVALNHLWDAGFDRAELRAIAAGIGSDVPFCVSGGTALATGTGTETVQVMTRGLYHWVVGISREPLSTAEVYRTHDEVSGPSDLEPDAVLQALRTGSSEALGEALHNDLEVATCALRPELVEAKEALLDAGALGAVVSGSGPTMVALAPSAPRAAQIAQKVRGRFDEVALATSPAGGPEVVED